MNEFVQLVDVIESAQSGFASGERATNGVVQLRMNNVTTDGNLDWSSYIRIPTTEKEISKYSLRPGDVLFNATNSPSLVGKTALFNGHTEPVVFSNYFVRLRSDISRLDPRYLAQWLTHQWQQRIFENLCTQWVNQATVRKEDLLDLEIPLPSLPEQQRIAAILDRADRLRRTRRYAAQLSDSFLQAVFIEMFGDPIKNPMGWDFETIEELCSKVIDYRGRTPPYSINGIQHITASCIKDSRIDWTQCKYVSEETFQEYMTRGLPERGDVLFTTEAPMGETAVVDTDERFSLAQRIVLLRPFKDKLQSYFLNSLLSHPRFFGRLYQFATGSTVVGIRSESLIAIPILKPPLPLQEKFARIVQQFDRLRAQQREAERQAENLFQALLHRAFGGELYTPTPRREEQAASSTLPRFSGEGSGGAMIDQVAGRRRAI